MTASGPLILPSVVHVKLGNDTFAASQYIFYLVLFVCCPVEACSFLMKDVNKMETEERGAGDE